MNLRTMTTRIVFILFLTNVLFNITPIIAQAVPLLTTFYVDPPSTIDPSYTPGSPFTIDVNVSDAEDLWGWQVEMEWDPTVLDYTGHTFGNFLAGQPGGTTQLSDTWGVDSGLLLCTEATIGAISGVDGDGWLMSVEFEVLSFGDTTIDISSDWLWTYWIDSSLGYWGDDPGEMIKEDGYFSNVGPVPTQMKFSLDPNPAIIGQTVTLLGNLTTAGSSPIGGATVTIKVNGSPVGTLTTNSTGWFKAGAPAPSTGEYTVRVEYDGSAEYLPSFDEHLLVVETGLSIAIYTDKDTYHAGDTMHLGLNVSNAGNAIVVDFKIWIALPSGGDYTYQNIPSVTIPAGLEYSNPNFDMITLPSIPPGNYTWHAAFLDPTTHTIIVEDTAEWEFV